MTDQEKSMIETYLPHGRDETLGRGEYYCRDGAGRAQRVRLTAIYPNDRGDGLIYGCVYADSGNHFRGYYGKEPFDGVTRGELYDNAEDCRAGTHDVFDNWERLRKAQETARKWNRAVQGSFFVI